MLIKRIKRRGATIVVEAHAEILMPPSAQVGRWHRALTNRVKRETAKVAPTNKRPRWSHYGKPLKSTFTASTNTQLTVGGGRLHSAIGSTAPYAYYVDQGTGIYGGGGPYPAKIIPPWLPVYDLYEATWRPGGPGTARVRPVMIKGQRGQQFFDKGLRRAFRSLGDARYKPLGGALSEAVSTFPEGLANFSGATPSDAGFRTQLEEWRTWRTERWDRDGSLGPRASKPDPVKPVKPPKPPKSPPKGPRGPKKLTAEQRGVIARNIGAALTKQGRQFRGLRVLDNGTWTALVKNPGQAIFKPTTGRWRAP